jgi:D-3-phosphoglycerate dehydrogenase
MAKQKVGLLTPQDKHGHHYKSLLETNFDVVYGKSVNLFPDYKYEVAELIALFGQCDGIIVGGRDKVPKDFIEYAPHLKVITKSSIGVEKIDVKSATEHGILVTNGPIPHNYIAVAEGTITLILSVLKRVFELDRMTRNGDWRNYEILPRMLYQKTIGLIGFGRIAKSLVQRLQGWDVKIIVYDPYVSDDEINIRGANKVSLDELLTQSDIVSIHVVLNNETTRLLNKENLDLMKSDSILINTSRGEVIDELYLYECLTGNKIAAAGLDVFEKEPALASNPLFQLDNVVVSPHGISLTAETLQQLSLTAIEECTLAIQGKTPQYIVNPEVLERWKLRVT